MKISALKAYLTPKVVIGATALVAAVAIVVTIVASRAPGGGGYVSPMKADVQEVVVGQGDVQPAEAVDLAFQAGGRLATVNAPVGSHVQSGDLLAALSAGTQNSAVEAAKAQLDLAKANLAALQSGARPEDVAVSEAAVQAAQHSLDQTDQALLTAANAAYVQADDAIRNKAGSLFSNHQSADPQFLFVSTNSSLQNELQNDLPAQLQQLSAWQTTLATTKDTSQVASSSAAALTSVNAYLDQLAEVLAAAVPSSGYSAATIAADQAAIATARGNVAAALTSISTVETAVQSAQSALATAQSQLSLKEAGPTAPALAAAEAQVQAAQAGVDAAQATLSQTALYAPIGGVITINNAHVGQTVTPGVAVISMNSDARYQFETYVSDIDLGKLSLGNSATISLDSYPGDTPLSASVIKIDPAATEQNGVSAYKVTLQFTSNDPRLKAGMTGAATIAAAAKSGVLTVPSSAIITENDQHFVLKRASGGDVLSPVVVGITGGSGLTEIVSGLTPADRIRAFGSH